MFFLSRLSSLQSPPFSELGRVEHWCSLGATRDRFDARVYHGPQQSGNSQRPLISRVEDWRANGRVRWPIHPFRSGPQSDSHGHGSSPRHVKPGVLISSTGLSWMLHLKGYVTYQPGRTFTPTRRTALGNLHITQARYRAKPYSTSSSRNLDGGARASCDAEPSAPPNPSRRSDTPAYRLNSSCY